MPRPKKGSLKETELVVKKYCKEHPLVIAPPAHSPLPTEGGTWVKSETYQQLVKEHIKLKSLFQELVETLEAFHMYCKVCKSGMAEHCVAKQLLSRCQSEEGK